MKPGKAPGWDDLPVEVYQYSAAARLELYRVIKLIWYQEVIPEKLVEGVFIMLHKKKDKNDFRNYRAICLLCHAYKLLSAVIAQKLHLELKDCLPDSQAGFRPERGTRDNICVLKWTIKMILRESRTAVVTFIDYTAAFDTESQLFLDEALSEAHVSGKLRRVIQSIFRAAKGCVRIAKPDGLNAHSEMFDINRGVLQGDIFSPVAFIIGLWKIFHKHDIPNSGITVGSDPFQVRVSKLKYADDAGLLDEDVQSATNRLTAIADGSQSDAGMMISFAKTKVMHIHKKSSVPATTENDIKEMHFKYKCEKCERPFPTSRGLSVHKGRWCDARKKNRSRTGSLADKAVKSKKRKMKENELQHVVVGNEQIENVDKFVYLGSLLTNDGDDATEVKHRIDIAQAAFTDLSNIWSDHRLPVSMKLRLYQLSVCSTLKHACESWTLTDKVKANINGFNSRCLHVITDNGTTLQRDSNKPCLRPGVGDPRAATTLRWKHSAYAT